MSPRPPIALAALLAVALLVGFAAPSAAGLELADVRGHIGFGFTHLFTSDTTDTPAGSLAIGAGVSVPLANRLRGGIDIGYHMLGSSTLVQGSLSSGIDYSVLEALALLHWGATRSGPEIIVSAGPGLFVSHATLAATSIGAAFSDQAVDHTGPGGALSVTIAQRRATPGRIGFEAGVRMIPLDGPTWTIATARIQILY